ncbi:unnamed protein product [Urochloa humidicola]
MAGSCAVWGLRLPTKPPPGRVVPLAGALRPSAPKSGNPELSAGKFLRRDPTLPSSRLHHSLLRSNSPPAPCSRHPSSPCLTPAHVQLSKGSPTNDAPMNQEFRTREQSTLWAGTWNLPDGSFPYFIRLSEKQ